MTEATLEKYIVARVKKLGGITYKFTSPSRRAVPDRIVIFPGGRIGFIELKAPGKKPSELQQFEMEKIENMGCSVIWADDKRTVDLFLYQLL